MSFFFFHCKNLKKSENFNNAIFVEYILTDFSSLKSKQRKFKLFSQVRDWLHLTNIVMTRLCIFISYKSYFNCYISSRLLPISPPPFPCSIDTPPNNPFHAVATAYAAIREADSRRRNSSVKLNKDIYFVLTN